MDLINELRQARSSPRTVLFRLLLDYKPNGGTLHAFFEGQDEESFYVNFLHQYLPSDYKLFMYRCEGKGNVIKVFNGTDRTKFDHRRLLFFMDRDYSDILSDSWPNSDNLYTTDHYSIENYLVTEEMFRRYLRDILHLDGFVDDENALAAHFQEELTRFHSMILIVSAWIIHVQQLGLRPNLSDIKLANVFAISAELRVNRISPRPRSILALLDSATGLSTPSGSWRSIRATTRRLRSEYSPKQYVRGKFELWFMVEFLIRIPRLINRPDIRGSRRVVVHTQLNLSNAIEILGPRVRMPKSLEIFLDHNFARLPH
jgi:uncharacterized protein DUF4435